VVPELLAGEQTLTCPSIIAAERSGENKRAENQLANPVVEITSRL
jgi:hypothetical protein